MDVGRSSIRFRTDGDKMYRPALIYKMSNNILKFQDFHKIPFYHSNFTRADSIIFCNHNYKFGIHETWLG